MRKDKHSSSYWLDMKVGVIKQENKSNINKYIKKPEANTDNKFGYANEMACKKKKSPSPSLNITKLHILKHLTADSV